MKKLLKKGAEAELYKSSFLGKTVLVKERLAKKYRHKLLDEKIRLERTKKEAALMHKAKAAGVRTPVIYAVDRKNKSIVMELVAGARLKEALNKKNLSYCKALGKIIGRLHHAGIIHGDLTTSNVIVKDKNLVLLDFGLGFDSRKIEDQAMDLLVLKKTFLATHFKLAQGWKEILKGYLAVNPDQSIIQRINEIEQRARYYWSVSIFSWEKKPEKAI